MFRKRVNKKRIVRNKRAPSKFQIPKGTKIDYKDLTLVKKYINDRGKILSRRITGISAGKQRALCHEIKKARFLGLMTPNTFQRQRER